MFFLGTILDGYLFIRTVHIISATILFGTGMGIAFFMFCSRFSDDLFQKYYAARFTVLADYIFTLPAVIIQPITGFWLIYEMGYDPFETWLTVTYILYVIAGICWVPVVWLQIKMKKMIRTAIDTETALPEQYHSFFRLWFLLGWPAFLGLVVVFFLMVIKPV